MTYMKTVIKKSDKVRYTPHIIGVSVPFRLSNAEIKVIR